MTDLQRLFNNEIPCLIVDNLLTAANIESFFKVLLQCPAWKVATILPQYEHLFPEKPKMKYLFESQYPAKEKGFTESEYLQHCGEYLKTWQDLTTACEVDPFQRFTEYLQNNFQVEIHLSEHQQARYCPLVVRDLSEEILPHADFGPYDGPDWIIGEVTQQLAWNIYLTDPGKGGETLVYDYVWDEKNPLDENSYGIKHLDKPVKVKFSVHPGRLVLFNSRNFHAVLASEAPRIAIGGMLGKTQDGRIIAWS